MATNAISKLWATKSFQKKMSRVGRESMKALRSNPRFARKQARTMKTLWANPRFRAAMIRKMREARA